MRRLSPPIARQDLPMQGDVGRYDGRRRQLLPVGGLALYKVPVKQYRELSQIPSPTISSRNVFGNERAFAKTIGTDIYASKEAIENAAES